MEEGCPQGTISGPVAWDIFVDDVVAAVSAAGGDVSLYADDIAICIRGKRVAELYRRGQVAMDGLHEWAQKNGVRVSLEKTTTTLLRPKGARRAAARHLRYGGQQVKEKDKVKLLGLWLDAEWTFGTHIGKVAEKMERRLKLLSRVSGASWGPKRGGLRTMYLALVQSVADYALPAYAPYVHPDALSSIRRIERESAMLVGGTIERTRNKAIYAEADTMPIDRRAELQSARMYERALRLPADNPLRQAVLAPAPEPAAGQQSRASHSWRRAARAGVEAAGLARTRREPIPVCAAEPPWEEEGAATPPTFVPFLDEKVTRKDPPEKRKQAALRTMARLPDAAVTVFTDGSVLHPKESRRGGGGFCLTDAEGKRATGRCPAGGYCNSMRAEKIAIHHALREMLEKGGEKETDGIALPRGAEVRIATDSQSAIRALQAGAAAQRSVLGQQIWSALRALARRHRAHVTIVYCPGHVQIAGNEAADDEAKAAAKEAPGDPSEDPTPIPLGVAATVLKRHFREQQAAEARRDDGHWAKACKDGPPKWKDHEGMTRAEQRILAQLRAGKCSLLKDYRHLCGWAESPACECGAPEQSVEHVLLQCPIHVPARNRLFVPPMTFGVEVLARFPERAARFLRDTGLNNFKSTQSERGARPKALQAEARPAAAGTARGWATRRAAGAAAQAAPGAAPAGEQKKKRPLTNLKGEAFRAAMADREKAPAGPRPESPGAAPEDGQSKRPWTNLTGEAFRAARTGQEQPPQ